MLFITVFYRVLFVALFVWQSLAVIWVFSRELKWPWWERALVMVATIATMVVWQLSVKDQPIWKVEDSHLRLPKMLLCTK
jgi:hypothetical protein